MATHNELGRQGELMAALLLEQKGYTIVDRNWRSGHKELDLVARKDNTLVIVEVKTRSGIVYGNPEDAVDARKIRRIALAADSYVRLNSLDCDVRFDIITVVYSDGQPQLQHIENAFYPPMGKI